MMMGGRGRRTLNYGTTPILGRMGTMIPVVAPQTNSYWMNMVNMCGNGGLRKSPMMV